MSRGCHSSDNENLKCRPEQPRKRNGLKISFLNIVSLRKHRHELEIVLNDHDIDIIGLNETRLDETISDSEVSISGYNIFRNDHDVNRGGVAIYVKASLPEPTVKVKSENLELISLEIAPQNIKNSMQNLFSLFVGIDLHRKRNFDFETAA